MAKHHERLSRKEVGKIFYQLCFAITQTKNTKEAAELLRDLLSYQEAEMIAKRLKIAELILENKTYDEIKEILKVSFGTIARVQEWIKISGDGYKRAAQQNKSNKREDIIDEASETNWISVKRKYPSYYWPELLLEEIVRSANKRQKERLEKVVGELEKTKEKKGLYKKLQRILQSRKRYA